MIDDKNFNSKEYNLRINPLIFEKNLKTSKKCMDLGLIYCLPFLIILNLEKLKIKYLFFGCYDHKKYNLKILSILRKNNFHNFQFYFDESYKSKKILKFKNIKFYKRSNFHLHLTSSEKVLCSGGLIAFESIYYNKQVYCLPQFEHQRTNITKLEKLGFVKCISIKDIKSILYDRKKTYFSVNKIFKKNEMLKTFLKINKFIKLKLKIKLNNKVVLVTGSSGKIGSYFYNFFKRKMHCLRY